MAAPAAAPDAVSSSPSFEEALASLARAFPHGDAGLLRRVLHAKQGRMGAAFEELVQWSPQELRQAPFDEEGREIYTWRIPLREWRAAQCGEKQSPEFELDGETWRFKAFPCGNGLRNPTSANCLSVYLQLLGQKEGESLHCGFKLRVLHPTDASKCIWREASHTFTDAESDRGFNDLLMPEQIADFCRGGWVAVQACMWKKQL